MRFVSAQKARSTAGVFAVGAALLAGCGTPPPTVAPDGVILRDDFTSVDSGWTRQTSQEQTVDYLDGRYLIAVDQAQVDVWGQPGLDLDDARIEAEAVLGGGPLDNAFGVACRLTGERDDASYIYFMISSDGYYAVVRQHAKERTFLNPAGDFEPLAAIDQTPEAVNRLSATCQGQTLQFSVNDQAVGTYTDDTLTHGDVAVMASTFNDPGVRILFDNVIVRQP
ncbi:MAG: hypothetical protein JNL73_01245 [Anaerolineales bacterium]|nr:hypothetical protein [Anaerolineales bacterium]